MTFVSCTRFSFSSFFPSLFVCVHMHAAGEEEVVRATSISRLKELEQQSALEANAHNGQHIREGRAGG